MHRSVRVAWMLLILTSLNLAGAAKSSFGADKENLVYVKDSTGKATSLLSKVVVVSGRATLAQAPDEQGDPIEPWAIFFRLKNNDGTTAPVNGKIHVGESTGKPIGWIAEKDLREWNTRFILDPIDPQRDRAFALKLDGGVVATQNAAPEGKRRYALITRAPQAEKGDDSEYPVVAYAGNVQGLGQAGTLTKQRNELRDVKLEIVFVIESTDFMKNRFKDDTRELFDYLKEMIRQTVATLRTNEKLKGAVKLGFVEYQDNVPKANFTSRKTCDLTDNFDQFLGSLDRLAATELDDDWPDDVIAGLGEAVQNVSWTPNSVKHIILLGASSCQLTDRGRNPNQVGGIDNILTRFKTKPRGHNSLGLSLTQLISRARPQGGNDSRARIAKTFHALLLGKELPNVSSEFVSLSKQIVNGSDKEVEPILEGVLEKLGEKEGIALLLELVRYQLTLHQRELATGQYKSIASNNGEADGIFQTVEPSGEKVAEAANRLSLKLAESFKVLESVRSGEGLPGGGQNELSQPLFTLVGAAAEKFKDVPVLEGFATVRDNRGREVAFKKVMVSEQELRHLKSTLDALYTKFKGKTSKADRQDVGGILTGLKEVLAETSAGQELGADVKLKDLISDLPLRTAALETTSADLALMTTEAFKQWLERVQAAVFRIEDLINNRQDWLTLSEKAVNERFTFLRLSELP